MNEKLLMWINKVLGNKIPNNVKALCFNLYENSNKTWSLEIVGCPEYDSNDTDWACEEATDFNIRNNPFTWQEDLDWKTVLFNIRTVLTEYFKNSEKGLFKNIKAAAVGFTDGELEVFFINPNRELYKKKNKIFIPPVFLIGGLVALTLIAAFSFDIFAFNSSPFEYLFRLIIALAMVVITFGRIYIRQQKSFDCIEKLYSEGIGIAFIENPSGYYMLLKAILDFHNEKYPSCIKKMTKLYDKAKYKQDVVAILLFSALSTDATELYDESEAIYLQLLDYDKTNATALNNLSLVYKHKGELDKAIKCATIALYANPNDYVVTSNLASFYLHNFSPKKAVETGLKALDICPSYKEPLPIITIAYSLLGESESSKKYRKKSLESGFKANDIDDTLARMKSAYKKEDEFKNKLSAWENFTSISAFNMQLSKNRKTKSCIGGSINEAPPIDICGNPMNLLCAIFCSELPENTLLPKNGVLRFYIATDDNFGLDMSEDAKFNKQNYFKVLFDDDESQFKTVPINSDIENYQTLGKYGIEFVHTQNAMPVGDYRFIRTYEMFTEKEPAFEAEEYSRFVNKNFEGYHRIGGYPLVESDIRSQEEYSKYDTLLLQLVANSEDNSDLDIELFDEVVCCQFFIPKEKLDKLDFSDIMYDVSFS